MKKILEIFNLSSLNVVLAAGICCAVFFKLPDGSGKIHWVPLIQLMLCTWLVYIVDRLLDIRRNPTIETPRHQFHYDNQFNFQLIVIGLIAVNIFLLFFEPIAVILGGGIITLLIIIYLTIIVPKWPRLKEFTMPFLFATAVLFAPFLLSRSITLSTWVLGLMFLLIIYQNLFIFKAFEEESEQMDITKWRKRANYPAMINLFIYIVLFISQFHYPNQLALIITIISIVNSAILSYSNKFRNNYRWILDGLLLLPLLLFLFGAG